MASPDSVPESKLRVAVKKVPTALRLIGGLALLVLTGTLLMMLPAMTVERPLSFSDALFTAVSSVTVTGLSVIDPSIHLTRAGQITLLALIQLGGVGYMVMAVLIFRLLGRSLSLTDRMTLQDALGLLNPSGVAQLTMQVFKTVLMIEGVGAVLLFPSFLRSMSVPEAALNSVFHAVSAFCNAGFDLLGGTVPDEPYPLTIIGILIILGGLGIPVLYDVLTYRRNKRITLHTRLTVLTAVGLIIWGALGLFLSEASPGGMLESEPVGRQAGLALFQSISARTAGLWAVEDPGSITEAGRLMIISQMFIGCAPASMGGGITTGTFLILVLALFAYARRHSTPVVYGRAIPGEMVRKAAAVLTIAVFAVLTSTWLIVLTHPHLTIGQVLFEVVSAFSTCGYSLGTTEQMTDFGRGVLIVMMFWGRLGALTILFALTRPRPPRRVTYPEEKILIG